MVRNRDGLAAQRRILILSGAIVGFGATIECIYILRNLVGALTPRSGANTLILATMGGLTDCPNNCSNRPCCASHTWRRGILTNCRHPYATIAYFALRAPYRAEKIAMLMFAIAIIGRRNAQSSVCVAAHRDALLLPGTGVLRLVFLLCTANQQSTRNLYRRRSSSTSDYGARRRKSPSSGRKLRVASVVERNTQRAAC